MDSYAPGTSVALSKAQLGIYIECLRNEESAVYHSPYFLRFTGLDAEKLAQATAQALAAYRIVSARLQTDSEGNIMLVDASQSHPVEVEIVEMDEAQLLQSPECLIEPFELLGGKLTTAKVIKTQGGLYLFLDWHHIISDGTSTKLLYSAIEKAYRGEAVPEETFTFFDYARADAEGRRSNRFADSRAAVKALFEGADTSFGLLPDISGGSDKSYATEIFHTNISEEQYLDFCTRAGAPQSAVATAVAGLSLQLFAGRQDVSFATIYAGRKDPRVANTFGYLVKTLPVRVDSELDSPLEEVIATTAKRLKTARDSDIYSFADAAQELGVNSEFLFAYQGKYMETLPFTDCGAKLIPVKKVATGSEITASLSISDRQLVLEMEYRSDKFSSAYIRSWADCYIAQLTDLIRRGTALKVRDLKVMSEEVTEQVIGYCNGGKSLMQPGETLISLFRKAAEAYPHHTAVVFKERQISYAELDDLTDRLAWVLKNTYGVGQGTIVGVMIERSHLMAVYPLAVMKAGGAYMPLDSHFPAERLTYMIEDAGVKLILSDDGLVKRVLPDFTGEIFEASALTDIGAKERLTDSCTTPDSVLNILYTSGSTGKPKGVVLRQSNVVNYCLSYIEKVNMTATDRVGAYASFGFDAHMIDLYPTFAAGATVHIFDEEMRLDLTGMHEYIEREKVSLLFMTTQVAWQMATLFDYTSLRMLVAGGEKLPPVGPLTFSLLNIYGPTECAIAVTDFTLLPGETTDGRDIGKPIKGDKIRIADKAMREMPVGAAGEIIISGAGVGDGYLNRPDLTAEKFITLDGKRSYLTGDLARLMANGDIEYLSRIDGMVKLRGLRIELGEIEAVATSHPAVVTFAAAVKQVGGVDTLVGYYVAEPSSNLTADVLRQYMSTQLTEFMVPGALVALEAMPLTPNGKVDRRALPVPEMVMQETVAPSNATERDLCTLISEILGHSNFGVTTNLMSVGLSSLMVMRLVAAIAKQTGLSVSAKSVMTGPTVREIAETMQQAQQAAPSQAVKSDSDRLYFPLSENQRGIYIDWELNRDALQYNISLAWRLKPSTDPEKLIAALTTVLTAHQALLTHLVIRNGDVMQKRHTGAIPSPEIVELDRQPDAEFFQSLVKPFDLIGHDLFKATVFTYGKEVYLFVDAHHIIFDGVSAMILLRDIMAAYEGKEVAAEAYTALDSSLREKEMLESERAEKAEEWFKELLTGTEPTSWRKSEKPDTPATSGMGRIRITLPGKEISETAGKWGVTVSNYFLSAFLQLLHRATREESIQIVTVNNGRSDVRLMDSIGMFVKTLPVTSKAPDPKQLSPREYATAVQAQFVTSQDFDFFPFTQLVERYGVRPEVMYVYEGGVNLSGSYSDSIIEEKLSLSLDTAKVPLTLLVFDAPNGEYELVVEYDTSVYSLPDMTVLAEMMRALSLSIPSAEKLADACMTDSIHEAQLAKIRYGERLEIPYTSFQGTMEQRADEQPDAPALIACDKRLTYREFDNECNRIANALIKRGVKPGDRVVILLPRRSYLITSIYGTLKTGAAYIPCDPEYPAERIRLITEDSEAPVIITTADKVALYPGIAVDVQELLRETDETRPGIQTGPEDVAYMIYTSGSTGRPKGVMIPQRGICNYLYGYWWDNYKDRPEIKTEALIVTISFDASLNNLGVSLTCGHALVLANEDECKDVVLLSKLFADNHVDSFDTTPSRLDAMLDFPEFGNVMARCKHINLGGEGFRPSLIEKLYATGFHGRAINEYGPTETTVGSNKYQVTPETPVLAGPPFANESQRVVDAWGGELPVGAVGELYIFGRGVGLGYNNLPERTAASFITFKGERGYRSGDLAYWTPEGDMAILGRIDHQVKLRGLRIELGEIESVACQHQCIGKAVADVREIDGVQHLCLYYTVTAPVDPEILKAHLANSLTEYMVPDAYIEINAIPLTPNGKANRKALPQPEMLSATEYVEPAPGVESTVAAIFSKVLNRERVGALDDFFAIGGSSISAIRVVAQLAGAGFSVTYKNLFKASTPRTLASLIEGVSAPAAPITEDITVTSASTTTSEFADILNRNNLDAYLTGESESLGNVMLTGATGFMGIHLLHELLTQTDSKILCTVRSAGKLSAASRLRTLLFYYFDDTFEADFASGRLAVLDADITQPLTDSVGADFSIDTVINCAANVKHFSAGDDIERVNVESVRHLIDFCLHHDARLVHVSTISVAGESVNGIPDPSLMMTEHMFDFGQNLSNQYVRSKYNAEKLIFTAIREKGLSAKIMRVGNLSPRVSDGEFQINFRTNAFMGKLRAYAVMGCAPYAVLDALCEFSPITEVCHAIRLLSSTPRDMAVFHPCNNHRLPLGDVFHLLNEVGHKITPVESAEFAACQRETLDDPAKVSALQPLLAYESDEASQSAFLRYDSTFTNQILYRLGFRWNYTSHDYVTRFLQAIDALDFFSV